MLKRILKSWKFWLVVLILTAAAYFYFYRNPSFVQDIISPPSPSPNLPENFDVTDVIQYGDVIDWKFGSDPVIANIISTDPAGKTMNLAFMRPTGFITERFGDKEPTLTVKISCTKKESSLYVTSVPKDYQAGDLLEAKLQDIDIDIFAEARDGESITGLCVDQDCKEINRSCRLYQVISATE